MIFKHFNFKKESNQWIDSKSYYPLCIPNFNPYNDNYQWLYKQLLKHRLVDFDFNNFRVNFGGDDSCLSFRYYYFNTFKKTAIGKLTQLVKHNVQNEQNLKISGSKTSSLLEAINWEQMTVQEVRAARPASRRGTASTVRIWPSIPFGSIGGNNEANRITRADAEVEAVPVPLPDVTIEPFWEPARPPQRQEGPLYLDDDPQFFDEYNQY